MPGRRQEPQLRRSLLVPLLLLLAGPLAAGAQQESAARAGVEAALKAGRVAGEATVFGGGVGLLNLGHGVAFGGAGWLALGAIRVGNGRPETDKDLRVAYGGLVVEGVVRRGRGWDLRARALLGAGNAKVSDRLIGVQLGADNFAVVEPEVGGTWQLARGAWLTGGLAYRMTFGVEDLPGISDDALRGGSLRVGIQLRSF